MMATMCMYSLNNIYAYASNPKIQHMKLLFLIVSNYVKALNEKSLSPGMSTQYTITG